MTIPTLATQFILHLPEQSLNAIFLEFDPQALANCEIDTKDLARRYPLRDPRRLPEEWLQSLEKRHSLGDGPVVIQTWRNLVQNTGCPAFDREFGVIQSVREHVEKRQRPYRGVSFLRNGRLRADSFDLSKSLPDDVERFATGIPVVWNGEILTPREIAADVSDFSHLFQINLYNATGPASNDERLRFEQFQQIYDEVRHKDSMTAGDAILEEARGDSNWAALNRTNSYQHNLIGIDKNGGIFILIANGRLEELGEIAFDHGCVTALVIDNGGSICCLQRRAPGKPLRSLLESHYWRPESVSVCVYSLKPGTSLLAAAPRQEPNFRLRSLTMRLHFRTHVGVVTRASIVARFDLEAARAAAVSIANFAVIHGASSVWIEAPEVWVKHVRAYFIERFRAARQAEDATTLRGLWLEFYLQGLFDTPFEIHAGVPSASSHGVHEPVDDRTRSDIACYSLGIDVGASAIKTALVKGDKLLKTCEVPTRPIEPHPYNSDWLSNQIQSGAQQLCQSAGIAVSDIDCIGISWAGAVRGGKAAPSKSLLDLQDVLNQTDLNIALLDRVRNLTTWIPKVLGVRGNSNVRVWNDGDVEVAAMKRPSTLLIKLGSTIAGGYTDCQGRTGYLTELGRVVIRLDPEAPRHPASRIQGTASMLIGGYALARICNERGLTTAAGQAFSNRNAGREVSELLRNGDRRGVEEVVVEMGRHMSELIIEVVDHLDDVTKILLRGGPMKGELGDLLQATILRELPETLAGIIDRDESESDSGAVAAARLASRF